MFWFVVVALVALGISVRGQRTRALERESLRRRHLGVDGVVVGGEGFTLARPGAPAVLLLHGAGDTPQTLRYLGDALFAHGFHVFAPLLPGHGRRLSDFRRISAESLVDAAQAAYDALCREHEWVGVIGLSMGGALATQLAAARAALPALGLVAPYLAMSPRVERAARWAWLWGLALPIVRSSEGMSIADPDERALNLAYGAFPARSLIALRHVVRQGYAALPRVTTPTLMIQSRDDNRIAPAAAERAFALLGAKEKHLVWVSGAAHVITVDRGRERVIAALVAWMEQHSVSS